MRAQPRHPIGGVVAGILAGCLMAGLGSACLGGTAGASSASSKEAQAKKSLLVRADFPKGWRTAKGDHGSTSGSGGDNIPGDTQLASCLGVPVSVVDGSAPSATSPEFNEEAQQLSVGDSVSVFGSDHAAQSMFAAIDNPKAVGCLTAIMQGPGRSAFVAGADLPKGDTFGTITVTKPAAGSLAPHAAGFTVSVPLTSQGVTVNVESTLAFFAKGSAVQTLTLTSLGSGFPRALSMHLSAVAAGRL